MKPDLKAFLDEKADQYNSPRFIENDPVSIPHRFKKIQDIEIAAFFSAILAWGQRGTIVKKANELMHHMDDSPYDFVQHHMPRDLRRLSRFKHRTFNDTDALYFVEFLRQFYKDNDSLENAFLSQEESDNVGPGLIQFRRTFFLADHPAHTEKHISTPERASACKRLNMFLRWMVRQDKRGVDFGIWKKISPSKLICPCDVHVERVARKLKLISIKRLNWAAAVELTNNLKELDPLDPVKYDFALFGLGIEEKF